MESQICLDHDLIWQVITMNLNEIHSGKSLFLLVLTPILVYEVRAVDAKIKTY